MNHEELIKTLESATIESWTYDRKKIGMHSPCVYLDPSYGFEFGSNPDGLYHTLNKVVGDEPIDQYSAEVQWLNLNCDILDHLDNWFDERGWRIANEIDRATTMSELDDDFPYDLRRECVKEDRQQMEAEATWSAIEGNNPEYAWVRDVPAVHSVLIRNRVNAINEWVEDNKEEFHED